MQTLPKILTVFHQIPEFVEFCIPELKSLFDMHGIPPHQLFDLPDNLKTFQINRKCFPSFPYVYIHVNDLDLCKQVLNRAVSITAFLETISEGDNYEQLFQNINWEILQKTIDADRFAFFVDTNEKKIPEVDKIKLIEKFKFIKFKGKVDLKTPQEKLWIIENYDKEDNLNPKKIYFGREIIKRPKGGKKFHGKYVLNQRPFLGPTSTDNDLAFMIANQAQITSSSFVYDPFLGTGSLLIPPSHFQAYCFGSELDHRVLMGYAVGQPNKKSEFYKKHKDGVRYDVFLNFDFYGFRKPEVFCMDVAKNGFRGRKIKKEESENIYIKLNEKEERIEKKEEKWVEEKESEEKKEREKGNEERRLEETKEEKEKWKKERDERVELTIERKEEESINGHKMDNSNGENTELTYFNTKFPANQFFDAIVSDPPYGLRAAILGEEERNCDDMVDLLFDLAERLLKKGGRLVYLYPILKEEGLQFSKIKHRESFVLIDVAENYLNSKNGRLCFTYQKL